MHHVFRALPVLALGLVIFSSVAYATEETSASGGGAAGVTETEQVLSSLPDMSAAVHEEANQDSQRIELQDGMIAIVRLASSESETAMELLEVMVPGVLTSVEPDRASGAAIDLPTRYTIESSNRKGIVDLSQLIDKDGRTVLVKLNHTLMWRGTEGGEFSITTN